MNKCLYCGKLVKNKFCNTSCVNRYYCKPISEETKLKISATMKSKNFYKTFSVSCTSCNKTFEITEKNTNVPKYKRYFCCTKCGRSYSTKFDNSSETKKAICIKCNTSYDINKRKSNKNFICESCKYHTNICVYCNKNFKVKRNKLTQQCCSRSCAAKLKHLTPGYSRSLGLASAAKRVKRSKNEIYFAELCAQCFDNILTNEPIFNGWDADVILPDLKLAVLWNGKWHYEKITEQHSVKQVQRRDKLKVEEIKKMNYTPYIIKDMGKHNKKFVEEMFQKFLLDIKT